MFLMLILIVQDTGQQFEKPPALVAFEKARKKIIKADIDWSETSFNGRYAGVPFYHRTRCTHDDIIHVYRGTETGMTTVKAETGEEKYTEPLSVLKEDHGEGYWDYDGGMTAQKTVGPVARLQHPFDYRSIGMLPVPQLGTMVEECLWTFPGNKRSVQIPRTYRQEKLDDGTYKVAMDQGDQRVIWFIDPELDWNATDCDFYNKGIKAVTCTTEYELHHGAGDASVWVPTQAAFFNSRNELFQLTQALRVEVNSPGLPDELRAPDIGIQNGINVSVHGSGAEDGQYLYADGELIDSQDYMRRLRAGEIDNGTTVKAFALRTAADREIRHARGAEAHPNQRHRTVVIATPDVSQDPWEKYTLGFIQQYKLNEAQVERAMAILRQCQEQRARYRQIAAFHKSYIRDEAISEAQAGKYEQRILDVFDKNLKPRLDRLPTRAQRKQAGEEGK